MLADGEQVSPIARDERIDTRLDRAGEDQVDASFVSNHPDRVSRYAATRSGAGSGYGRM
jgi:hypothetical protein